MVSIEIRSMTENKCWEGLDFILRKLLACGLKEGIKAVWFLRVIFHGSSMAKSYVYLKMLALIIPTHKRTEERAPAWGSEFTTQVATLQGDSAEIAAAGWIRSKQDQRRGY